TTARRARPGGANQPRPRRVRLGLGGRIDRRAGTPGARADDPGRAAVPSLADAGGRADTAAPRPRGRGQGPGRAAAPPLAGEDRGGILAELVYDTGAVAALRASGVI